MTPSIEHCLGCDGSVATYSGQGESYECPGIAAAEPVPLTSTDQLEAEQTGRPIPYAEPVPLKTQADRVIAQRCINERHIERLAAAVPPNTETWNDGYDAGVEQGRYLAAAEGQNRSENATVLAAAEPVPLTLDALTLIPFVERPMTAAYFEDLKAGRLSSEQVARAIAGDLAALASPDKGEPR